MQCNTSFVILDPKGEIVRDIGGLLENKGYEVRVLDLINCLLYTSRPLRDNEAVHNFVFCLLAGYLSLIHI